MKKDIELNSKCLLSIFSSKGVELPWRFQNSLRINIPFEEYVIFVSEILRSDYDWLAFPRESYRKAIEGYSDNPQTMLRLFYNDLSFAQYYEWDLALEEQKGCSLILPKFESGDELVISRIDDNLVSYVDESAFEKVLKVLPARMPKCVEMETKQCTGRYFDIKEYILFLRYLTFTPDCKRINFKEDE